MPLKRSEIAGIGLALISATAFGATAIIAKLAYREHVNVATLLAVRFTFGAVMLWGLALVVRVPRTLDRRTAAGLLALGAIGYATQSRMVFEALKRIPAGTAILLLYAYPAIVALLAFALRRDRIDRRKVAALALGLAGLVMVLGAPARGFATSGAVFALTGALVYAVYITIAERVIRGVHPLVSSAVIVSGAAVSFDVTGAASGAIRIGQTGAGWLWLTLLAFVSIAVAVSTFLAAVERIGPTRASIASTWEPVCTVLLAAITLSERLSSVQLLGGALVVAAVAVLPLTMKVAVTEGEAPVPLERTRSRYRTRT